MTGRLMAAVAAASIVLAGCGAVTGHGISVRPPGSQPAAVSPLVRTTTTVKRPAQPTTTAAKRPTPERPTPTVAFAPAVKRPVAEHPTPAAVIPATTGLVATPAWRAVPVLASPGGARRGSMRAVTFGGATWRPVLARRPGWVEIRRMGDGSPAGWVPAGAVHLAGDPWQVVVDLASGRLSFVDGVRVVLTAPVAHGRASMPTPDGATFLAGDVVPTGPDALEAPVLRPTGEHSLSPLAWQEFPALTRGGSAAVTAIHGWLSEATNPTLWSPSGHGLPASHGCMRLPTGPATTLLAQLPTGTPVTILAG
jgi:predicted small secreted protein